ncbi:MAG TPA: hypothetical protein VKD72_31900 [Gemmataceae bacterium]|nr:hypothetical protein [Gemmataceae bacterium]
MPFFVRFCLTPCAGTLAGLAGFNDAAYFSVVFKREVGTTPGTFRARYRGPA